MTLRLFLIGRDGYLGSIWLQKVEPDGATDPGATRGQPFEMPKRVSQDAFGALFTGKTAAKMPRLAASSTDWCKRCIDGPSYKKGHAPTCTLNKKKGDVTESDIHRYCNQAYKFLQGHRDNPTAIESKPWYPNLVELAGRANNVKGVGPTCTKCFNPTKKRTKDARDKRVKNAGETYYVCTICNAWCGWCRDIDFKVPDVVSAAKKPVVIEIEVDDVEEEIIDLTE